MKVLLAFFICIVAVFGESTFQHRLNENLKPVANACIRELYQDSNSISNSKDEPIIDPNVADDPNFIACMAQKMGVMNEDKTFNLERILSFSETPEEKQRVENTYKTRIKQCASTIGKDACKMTACVYKMLESKCRKIEQTQ